MLCPLNVCIGTDGSVHLQWHSDVVFRGPCIRLYTYRGLTREQRSQVPQDLTSESPDPSTWPAADAAYPASGCDPTTFFNPQTLILNTDICG
jgi:hypothetical protein